MTDFAAAQTELKTLRDFLRWTTSRFIEAGLFYGHGNEDAFNEASQLGAEQPSSSRYRVA